MIISETACSICKSSIYTDNNPLTYVFASAKFNAMALRWIGELSDFECEIKFCSGKPNLEAEIMPRLPSHMEQYIQTVSFDGIQANIAGINAMQKGDTSWANAAVPITFQLTEQEQPVGLTCSQTSIDSFSANNILDAQVNHLIISKVLPYVKKKNKLPATQLHTTAT